MNVGPLLIAVRRPFAVKESVAEHCDAFVAG
jgi:hypothetical protein